MSQQLYTIVSLSARYFFVAMLFIIVIRSYIWLRRDNAAFKKYRDSIAAAGVVGEAKVLFGNSEIQTGQRFEIYREGIIGRSKNCDMRVLSKYIAKRQLYYRLDEGMGLYVEPLHSGDISINAFKIDKKTRNAYIINGSILKLADISLQFFFYPGFSIPTLSPEEMNTVMDNVSKLYYIVPNLPNPNELTALNENIIEEINEREE